MTDVFQWILQLSLQERLLLSSLVLLMGAGLIAALRAKKTKII